MVKPKGAKLWDRVIWKGKIHFVRPVFSRAICDWLEYKTKKWNDGWILPSEMRKKVFLQKLSYRNWTSNAVIHECANPLLIVVFL